MQPQFSEFVPRILHRNKCPGAQQLAAYADRQLIGPQRHVIENHLASCDKCIQQISFLLGPAPEGTSVPTETLNKALALAKRDARQAYPTSRLAFSAAFVLLLVAMISWRFFDHARIFKSAKSEKTSSNVPAVVARITVPSLAATHDVVRGSDTAESLFLFPTVKGKVAAANLVFRWKAVPRAKLYEIELVTDDGTVIWTDQVKSTSLALPVSVHLVKGGIYFVRLRVRTENGPGEVTKAIEFIAE